MNLRWLRIFGWTLMLCFSPLISTAQSSIAPEVINQHKSLYSTYKTNVNLARETSLGKDVDVSVDVIHDYVNNPNESAAPSYPNIELRRLSCGSDAIVTAIPSTSETAIVDGGEFLFTDSLFHISSVINGTGLDAGDNIVVTRPGGELLLNGHNVRTEVSGFPQFQIGRTYLLFLKYLPESKSYEAFRVGTFTLAPKPAPLDSSQSLGSHPWPSTEAFLTEVRAAATAPCAGITPALQ